MPLSFRSSEIKLNRPTLLVLDQGTHASRGLLISLAGEILYSSWQKVTLSRPRPHQVEQNAEEILTSIHKVIEECRAWATQHEHSIHSIGLATQRSTVVAWDKTNGRPLAPAISWQDTRTAKWLAALEVDPQEIRTRTGLPLSPHYGASKMRWLLEHVPAVRNAADHHHLMMGPLASYLLSGIAVGHPQLADHSNASRTLLWNLQTRDWDPWLIDLFGIDLEWLPKSVPIQSHFGVLKNTDIPINLVNGDQSSAMFGHGPVDDTTAIINMGTGAFIILPSGDSPKPHPRLLNGIVSSHSQHAHYCLEATVNGAGAALEWVQEQFAIKDIHSLDWAAIENPPVIINTIGGLGSPWWVADVDLKIDCTAMDSATCVASVMESIVFMLTANLRELQSTGCLIQEIKIGGGLSQSDELCQRLANATDIRVRRSAEKEITALGTARLLAGEDGHFKIPAMDDFEQKKDHALEARFEESMHLISELVRNSKGLI